MSAYEYIELDVSRAGVAVVLLDRPDLGNPFNAKVVEELSDVFEMLSKNPEVRLVLLRGAGPKFSAGLDLEWLRAADDFSQHEHEEDGQAAGEMLMRLRNLPQTTICLVQGAADGLGVGLVAASDIAIAIAGTTFCVPEVSTGAIPAVVMPVLVEAVGARRARAIAITAETFEASFAQTIGLVQYVAEDETAMEALAEALARRTFAASPAAIAATKDLIEAVEGEVIDGALVRLVAKRGAHAKVSADGKEGLRALLDGRDPVWNR